jgi:hypothetical protein
VLRANVFGERCTYDQSDPAGYRSGMAKVGEQVAGEALAVKVFELPPGESVCPYHYGCDSDVYAQGSGHGFGIWRRGSRRQSA